MPASIPKIFWLWIPVVGLVVQFMIEAMIPGGKLAALHSEGGPHEALQFFFIFTALLVSVRILFLPQMKEKPVLYGWVGLAVLACFYVSGEEISWGQHVFEWGSSDFWLRVNDQGETNLHNTSSWLDQKPRLVLELGVLVGGIIIPLLRRLNLVVLPQRFAMIYPSSILFVTALMVFIIFVLDQIDKILPNTIIFERASEVEELYLFYFVLLYMWDFRLRLVHHKG